MAQTFEAELMRCARNVARIQARRRRLKRELKRLEQELRTERKNLKAIAAVKEPDVVPSRLFGSKVGIHMADFKKE